MDFIKSLQVAASGLHAQIGRMRVITANIANATPIDAVAPGRSPSATPTATGTAAFSTSDSGETTEIGPALTAA